MKTEVTIIDVHAHIYPNVELGLISQGGASVCGYDGTVSDLIKAMKKNNISNAVALSFLPTGAMLDAARSKLPGNLSEEDHMRAELNINKTIVERYKRRNLWTCNLAKENPQIIPFIGIDPIMSPEEIRAEVLEKVEQHGAKGIKLNPGEQRFYVNNRRIWPAYEIANELSIPVYSHSGRVEGPKQYSEPKYFEEVLVEFPKLNLILGHLGFGYWDQMTMIGKKYPQAKSCCTCLLDWQTREMTSFNVTPLSNEELVSLIREFGVDRVMWGSEYPFFNIDKVIGDILNLPLKDEEKRKILGDNARTICGIKN